MFYTNLYDSFSHNCFSGESSVFPAWFRGVLIFVSSFFLKVGYAHRKPKLWTKSFQQLPVVSLPFCVLSFCGKKELIFRILLENTLSPKLLSIFFNQHDGTNFKTLEGKKNKHTVNHASIWYWSSKTVCWCLNIQQEFFHWMRVLRIGYSLDVTQILV